VASQIPAFVGRFFEFLVGLYFQLPKAKVKSRIKGGYVLEKVENGNYSQQSRWKTKVKSSVKHAYRQSMWAERDWSAKRIGAGRKLTWAERRGDRGSKNQAERKQSVSGRLSDRERSGERARSAAQNPLHHKTA